MANAQIIVNGVLGGNDNLPLGEVIALTNNNAGDETTWLWEIVSQPEGSIDPIPNNTLPATTLTPLKIGSYLVKLTVNAGLPSEKTNTVLCAVRTLLTTNRLPAAGEKLEGDPLRGWSLALDRFLKRLERQSFDGGRVAALSEPADNLDIGSVVTLHGTAIFRQGTPDEAVMPLAVPAVSNTISQRTTVGLVERIVFEGAPIGGKQLLDVRVIGTTVLLPFDGTATLAVGDEVHLSSTLAGGYITNPATIAALPSGARRLIGVISSITAVNGLGRATEGRVLFNGGPAVGGGAGGGGEEAEERRAGPLVAGALRVNYPGLTTNAIIRVDHLGTGPAQNYGILYATYFNESGTTGFDIQSTNPADTDMIAWRVSNNT